MDSQETALVDPLTDPRVFAAVQEYQAELDAGDCPDLTAFLARHPDIAGPLAGCLRGLEFLCAAAPRVARPVSTRTPAPAAPDARLGDFRVVREVGRGGMGVVYEAEQLSLGRRVALKVVSLPPAADRARRRFHHEAHAAAVLSHPHIVPVYAVGSDGDKLFLAMRFVEGRSLAAVLARLRTPTAPTDDTTAPIAGCDTAPLSGPPTAAHYRAAARLAAVAADALQHAHDLGIVHRDVKPGNLLLEPNGHLWVADFGLARLPEADDLTRTGEVLGTLRYMSPEQATGAAVDHRSDVYSLGATLYELLTFRPAFPGSDPHEVLRRITGADPTPPRVLAPTLPADLETIALKAMAKEPAERYPTARAFADDLDRFLTDRPITARPPTLARRVTKWVKRNLKPLSVVAGGVFVTLLAVTVALAVSGEQLRTEQRLTAGLYSELTQTAGQLNQANADLTNALAQARRAEYTYRFLAARREWLDGNPGRAEELLDSCPPEYRRWEWGYLKNLCRPGLQVVNELEIPGTKSPVGGLGFHPDGSHLSLSRGGIHVWGDITDVTATHPRYWIKRAPSLLFAADPDGKRLYSVEPIIAPNNITHSLLTYDFGTGDRLGFAALPGPPRVFSPDARHLICSTKFGLSKVSVPDAKTVSGFKYSAPPNDIRWVKYAPSGRWLVVVDANGRVKLLSAQTGETEFELPNPAASTWPVAVSPNDRLLAVTSGQQAVVIWDLVTRREVQTLQGHTAAIKDLSFAPDGRRLASVGADRVVRVWDAVAGKEMHAYRGHDADLGGVAFDPTGVRLATADVSGRVVIWDATVAQDQADLPAPAGFGASLDTAQPLVRMYRVAKNDAPESVLQTIDLATATSVTQRLEPGTRVRGAPFTVSNGDGRYLKPVQRGLMLCDPAEDRLVALSEPVPALGQAVMSRDRKWLAVSGCLNATIFLFDPSTGECRHHLLGHKTYPILSSDLNYPYNLFAGSRIPITAIAFHPTAEQLLSAGADGTVRLWDTRTGQCTRTLSDHANDVGGVAYSPDGRLFATVGWDGATHLYSTDGVRVRTLRGGEGKGLAAVAFTPDGSRLATVGRSGWLRLWDPYSGEEYLSVRDTTARPAPFRSLGFSADGRFLVGVDTQGRPTVWDGDTVTSEQRQARQAARLTGWHQAQAADAEKAKDWFAAVWYRQQLATREPENTEYKAQFEKAKTSLAAERTGK